MSGLLRELLRRVMDEDNNEAETESESSDTEPLAGVGAGGNEESEEEEQFDIALPASHSYMGSGQALGGRALLAAGWVGRVPLLAAGGALFPGEVVPLLLTHPQDARALQDALRKDKLFGLLATDPSGARVSRYGTLCEVFEVAGAGGEGGAGGGVPLSLKARAIHRIRLAGSVDTGPIHLYSRVRSELVEVLAEPLRGDPLRGSRLASLDARRAAAAPLVRRAVRTLDAAGTAWPRWVYDMFSYERLRRDLASYFRALNLEDKMPADEVSLSYWASANMALSAAQRLDLLRAGDARGRLRGCAGAARAAAERHVLLRCGQCRAPLASAKHATPMSSDGLHSNYTNPGGFLHDVVTVSQCRGVALSGAPSAEYSWFPGYSWTIALCAGCSSHVGWRFKALRRTLRPQQFYGLSRHYVEPAEAPQDLHEDPL